MSTLVNDWKPSFGTIYTWFAMDKNGKIAVVVNNNWGWLPNALLSLENFEELLDQLNEYKWEESAIFVDYPEDKKGSVILDLYSHYFFRFLNTKSEVEQYLKDKFDRLKICSDYNLPLNKGFFIYQAIEGNNPGDDYPVGYEGETKMGDYFRYLMPTIYASIEDFPEELRHGIAISDTIDFTKDRLLDNDKISEYFPRMYHD